MKDNFKKLSVIAIIVFVVVFIFLSIAKLLDIDLSPRNLKVLEVILLSALSIMVSFLIYKTGRGYISIVKNRDTKVIKEIIFLIIMIVIVMILLNLIVNKGKIIKRELIEGIVRLITFMLIIMGIGYEEMNNNVE